MALDQQPPPPNGIYQPNQLGARVLFFTTLGKHLYDIALHDRFAIKAKSFRAVVFKHKPKLALRSKGADVGSELTIAQLDSAINKVLNDRLRCLRHHFSPLHFSSIHSRRTLATVLSWRAA